MTLSSLLILTVGTGTSGAHSNLAQGLVNTLALLGPRLFWLVPSTSADSVTLAQMVRDEASRGCAFQPWSAAEDFLRIERPDDLFACRAALREVIHAARQHLRAGEHLMVNPTSGTKQMAAAYLADKRLSQSLALRNETMYGHGQTPVDAAWTQDVAGSLRRLLREHLPAAAACWSSDLRPRSLSIP